MTSNMDDQNLLEMASNKLDLSIINIQILHIISIKYAPLKTSYLVWVYKYQILHHFFFLNLHANHAMSCDNDITVMKLIATVWKNWNIFALQ